MDITIINFISLIIGLACTEGLAEFLPISSSMHSAILMQMLDVSNHNIYISVANIGSTFALLVYFMHEFWATDDKRQLIMIWLYVITTTIFVSIFLYFAQGLKVYLKSSNLQFINSIIFASLLYFLSWNHQQYTCNKFNFKTVALIGSSQIIAALMPGVSRLGITLTVAFYLRMQYLASYLVSMRLNVLLMLIISSQKLQHIVTSNIVAQNIFLVSSIAMINIFIGIFFLYYLFQYYLEIPVKYFCIYRIIISIFGIYYWNL